MFTVSASDPEGDDIQYGLRWGDSEQIEWTDWFSSNETCTIHHQWNRPGVHEVKVKARDIHLGSSNWSECFVVNVEDENDPVVQVEKPLKGLYIKNEKILPFFTSIVFGDVTIFVNATDASGINKVVFYIDDMLNPVAEALNEPYQFTWDEPSYKRHKVKIIGEDNAGKQTSYEYYIWKFF